MPRHQTQKKEKPKSKPKTKPIDKNVSSILPFLTEREKRQQRRDHMSDTETVPQAQPQAGGAAAQNPGGIEPEHEIEASGSQSSGNEGSKPPDLDLLKDFASKDPETTILINAMKSLGQGIYARIDNLEKADQKWKADIGTRLNTVETTIKERGAKIAGYNETIEFMQTVAKNTDDQSKGIDKRFRELWAQVDSDRVSTIRAQLEYEDRIKSLEREVRSFNLRVQGIPLKDKQNVKEAVLKTFEKAVPELKKVHIEFAVRIPQKRVIHGLMPGLPGEGGETGDEQPLPMVPHGGARADARGPKMAPTVVLIRFTDKYIRNQVFFESKRNKDHIPYKIIVREDMIKQDLDVKTLAKPQMEAAYTAGKQCKCRYGKLTIDSRATPIEGVKSREAVIHELNEAARLDFDD